jgi:hypothetical protein
VMSISASQLLGPFLYSHYSALSGLYTLSISIPLRRKNYRYSSNIGLQMDDDIYVYLYVIWKSFEIPFSFRIDVTAVMHGFGCWFDIGFTGEQSSVALSTAPDQPTTHW